jgi:hypothetical protein
MMAEAHQEAVGMTRREMLGTLGALGALGVAAAAGGAVSLAAAPAGAQTLGQNESVEAVCAGLRRPPVEGRCEPLKPTSLDRENGRWWWPSRSTRP